MRFTCWLQDSHVRIHPTGNARGPRALGMDAARGDHLSFQVAVENASPEAAPRVAVEASAPDGVALRIRRVGFVPLPHHNTDTPDGELDCRGHAPGFVPDPLFDETEAVVARGETAAFWVSVRVSPDCRPGRREIPVTISCGNETLCRLSAALTVHDAVIRKRRDFPVTNWFYSDALLDWYGLPGFDERYWERARAYVADIAGHGQDMLYVPSLTPSTDGVKRPTQLLGVSRSEGRYRLDWTDVSRYVSMAREAGIERFEWPHLFTQWGARSAIRVYEGQGREEKVLWAPETSATSEVYAGFLSQYLGELRGFLDREGIAERSFFHLSDEPSGEEARRNYAAARGMLGNLAPWMRTFDALSEIEYGREKLTDMPAAGIAVARRFVEEGIPCFAYFCCEPRGGYLNRLLDTPLPKIRMSGWLFYKMKVRGFLHWGYNYWYRRQTRTLLDPFTESSGAAWPDWAYGDTFLVYPGERGPIDSIRWEIFSESLDDYALLQTLGVDPGSPLLAPLKDFDRFPKDLSWLRRARRGLLTR
jgi:hypothetical protein